MSEQPPASDIVCDRHDDGRVVFYVPAMGISKTGGKSRGCFGLGGWLVMSLACASFALLFTISGLFDWRDAVARPWNAWLFCLMIWVRAAARGGSRAESRRQRRMNWCPALLISRPARDLRPDSFAFRAWAGLYGRP